MERVPFYMLRVGRPGEGAGAGGQEGGKEGEGEGATPEVVFIAATDADLQGTHVAIAEVARGMVQQQHLAAAGGGGGKGEGEEGGKKGR